MIELIAENFKLIGENKRLIPSKGRLISNPKYTRSKIFMFLSFRNCIPANNKCINYTRIEIEVWTYLDIDNGIKQIIDTIEALELVRNDREITQLKVTKHKIKRDALDSVKVILRRKYER